MSLVQVFSSSPDPEDVYDAAAHRNAIGQLRDTTTRQLGDLIKFFKQARPQACEDLARRCAPKAPDRKPPPVPGSWMWFAGSDRGCEYGFCCVYSMWFNPEYQCVRECTHRCSISRGRFAHCGSAIFEDCVLAQCFTEYVWRNLSRFSARIGGLSKAVLSKRRKPRKNSIRHQESYQSPQTPQAVTIPRPTNSFHIVQNKVPKPKRTRNPRRVCTFSRIRKCMGSTSFGKLGAKREKKVPIPPGSVGSSLSPIKLSTPGSPDSTREKP